MLYSYKNQYPQPIPYRIRLSDGRTRTDPNTFTQEEILDAGYVEVLDSPVPTKYQVVSWTGVEWNLRDMNAEEIAAVDTREAEQLIKSITDKTQQRLDRFAQTRGYDNIVSACSYATSQHPKYGVEGTYCVKAREDTWDALYAILAEVQAGTRPKPSSYEDIEADLPVLQWPQ